MSSVIGVELAPIQLVLTRGRDFKWSFQNLDDSKPPVAVDYPAGDLYFELNTGGEVDSLQQIEITRASGGTYKLSFNGQTTAAIAFDEIVNSPEGATPDVTSALEALSSIGAGNVSIAPAQLFPVWEINLTLNAGNNELQQLQFTNATGGNFKLGYNGVYTPIIAYGAVPSVVQTALQALTGIGTGNIAVTPIAGNGYQFEFIGTKSDTDVNQILVSTIGIDLTVTGFVYGLTNNAAKIPSAQVSTVMQGSSKFTDTMVNLLNTTVNNLFNSFDTLLGVNIEYEVLDNLNTKLTVTSLVAFAESDLLTFSVNIVGDTVEGFLDSVAQFVGIFDTIDVDFYWNRYYQVEFVNSLGLKLQPAITSDITLLTGLNDEQAVEVTVLEPGKAKFTQWPFDIDGNIASIKIESEVADLMPNRTPWQLVFLPDGEAAGGDPIARGLVKEQF